jgi:type IV secretory pathway TrbL component
MLKQVIYLVIASLVVVLLAVYLDQALQQLSNLYTMVAGWFSEVFASGRLGSILTELLSLFLIPLVITGVIAGAYWAFRRKSFPYFNAVVWTIWLVLATLLVVNK